ncbi:50S ribosomal protein L22 [Pseudoclostridium thermosuccinogenes]|uniref:50S ribosomal protein L22 n=1 Tax=Clostridium thermosuccinogenes TaxID=84032 RepID=UPI00186517AC
MLTKKERKALGIGKDQGKAILRNARISSRKVKIVLDLIKNKPLEEAYAIVKFTPKAASEILYKLLKSAEANAVNNNGLNKDVLYVADAVASQGPTLKRMRPRAQGRGFRINKRTSNITVVLKEKK